MTRCNTTRCDNRFLFPQVFVLCFLNALIISVGGLQDRYEHFEFRAKGALGKVPGGISRCFTGQNRWFEHRFATNVNKQ